MPLGGVSFDTMLASYCLDPARRSHGLDALALEVCGHTMIPFDALFDRRTRVRDIRRVPLPRVVEYACEDADYTLRVARAFAPLLEVSQVHSLFHDVEMPLSGVLMRMEQAGVRIDTAFLAELSRRYAARIGELEEEIFRGVGERFNPASTPKLREILFDRLGLKPSRRTKTGFSTDADVLETLAGQHPVVELLLEWRALVKLKSTYVDALPRLVHPETGRVHTSFHQAVASTGRLSSSDPNLQNIPIRTPEGREIRRAFVARGDEWVLLDADYSQIELRILAHLSGDEGLIQAFVDDADVHRRTAARVMNVDPDAVTPEMRARAKVVNFGIVYGMGARGLAQSLGIDAKEARRFIAEYFRSYPGVRRFIDDTIARARRDKAVTTLLGRTRRLPDIDSTNPAARAFFERVAVNTPVQGTAADIIKLAMVSIDREILARSLASRMILTVHDELLFDVPQGELETMRSLVAGCMERAMRLRVPLKVDMGTGKNWLEAH
jgi:DNA polymerase-1